MPTDTAKKLPWYLWPLAPLMVSMAVLMLVIVGLPLCILVVVTIPFWAVYPDRHVHIHDEGRGTPAQIARLAQWRAEYDRLGFFGRINRMIERWKRRWRTPRAERQLYIQMIHARINRRTRQPIRPDSSSRLNGSE